MLLLLGEVHAAMNDLPAAGAAWFLTALDTEDARTARAAFRARYPKAVSRADALPVHRPLAEYPDAALARVRALRGELKAEGWSWHPPVRPRPAGRPEWRPHPDRFARVVDDQDLPEPRAGPGRRLGRIALKVFWVYVVVGFLAVWVLGFVTGVRWIWG